MSEKKVISRNVGIALGIVAIVFVAGLVGTVASYTSIINGKDQTIALLNSQITEKDSTIQADNSQIQNLQA